MKRYADVRALRERDGVTLSFEGVGAEGQHDQHDQRGREGHDRGQDVVGLADVAGEGVLLEEELEAVGGGLDEAALHQEVPEAGDPRDERVVGAVGSDAALDPGRGLALEEHGVAGDRHHDEDEDQAAGRREVPGGVEQEGAQEFFHGRRRA